MLWRAKAKNTKTGASIIYAANELARTHVGVALLRRDLPKKWRIKNNIEKLTTVANVFMPIEGFSISMGRATLKIFIEA